MALDDVKDNLLEQLRTLAARVQESTAWLQLSEKFNNLSPVAQKAALTGAVFFSLLILLFIPLLTYFSSLDRESDFEGKQALIRQLYRVNREANQLPPPPPTVSSGELQMRVRNILTAERLQPEQIVGINVLQMQKGPGLPASLAQSGVNISLSKLNLYQIVDIGSKLQSVHPLSRIIGLDVKATNSATNAAASSTTTAAAVGTENYFDVVFNLVAFSTPDPNTAGRKDNSRGKSGAE